MTEAEKKELAELGQESCPCFCTGNKNLDELMQMDTAPNQDEWFVWICKPHLQDFVRKFFPEFCEKMLRFIELEKKLRNEERRPTLF